MTTLAYKDGILAADGKATRGEMIVDLDVKKVRRLLRDGSLVGITGMPAPAAPFIEWLEAGGIGQSPSLGSNCCVVHLKPGALRVYEDGGWMDEDPAKSYAWGSGWQIATTAMICGKSAEQAVKLAITMDIWSGGKVIAMPLKRKPITQRQADRIVREVRDRKLSY